MGAHSNKNSAKAQAKFRQGLALHEKGQFVQADALYRAALQLDAQHAESLHHLGILALQAQDLEYAADLIRQSIQMSPNNPAAFSNLGMVLEDLWQPEASLAAYNQAIALDPDHIEANLNRGNVLQTLARWEDALISYDRIIALMPAMPDAYNNRGNVLRALGRQTDALESFDQAIRLKPDFAQAFNNRGIALKELKQFDAALLQYDRAIALQPTYAQAYSNRGVVLKELRQFDLALQSFDQAIALKPDYAQAYGNRGGLLQALKKYEAAYENYDHALILDPSITALYGKRLHMQMHGCNWNEFNSRCEKIIAGLKSGQAIVDPFTLLSLIDSPDLQQCAAQIAIRDDAPVNPTLGLIPARAQHPKIRLAYFSPDFCNHPVSFLTVELFEKHHRDKFELIAFSLGRPVRDDMQQRVAAAFDQFLEVGDRTDTEITAMARELEIDIAIDLGGFTTDGRPGVFARRAAPVQAGYIGYLGTMGASYYDYILADHTLIPPVSRNEYNEKIVYLPSYQANDSKRKIADREFTRSELGLPKKGFVFCCFNNNYKFTPATFDSWMRILQAVESSVLLLYADNSLAETNLKKEAVQREIDPSRLVFGKGLARDAYLARYRTCDLFLDTLPYNAGTTASDALWAGLPVLTCRGKSFASRMAASLLTAMDLPELITASYAEYEAKAIECAKNPPQFNLIRKKISTHRHTSPLFNSTLFCQHLETAYSEMHRRETLGLPADHIDVTG